MSILLSTLDESVFFEQLSSFLRHIFPQDRVVLYKAVDPTCAIMMAIDGESPVTRTVDKGAGVACHVIRTKRAYYSNSLRRDPLFVKELYELQKYDVKAELCVPILCENIPLGTVHLQSDLFQRNFGQGEIEKILVFLRDLKRPITNMQMYLSAKHLNEALLKKIEEKKQVEKSNHPLNYFVLRNIPEVQILGKSRAITAVLDLVDKVAATNSHVLISGEAGTGKELLGRKIHQMSWRKGRPYIVINCAAFEDVSGDCQEMEQNPLREIFKLGQGGTLFFKNVGDLKSEMQMKLLRLLQENEIYRESGKDGEGFNVRIISSTSKDLMKEIEAGRFLDGLYFRLYSVHIKVPSLSQRDEDILVLGDHHLNGNAKEEDQKIITPGAMKVLMSYNWPGNIRELQNIMRSAQILAGGKYIESNHLPEELNQNASRKNEENQVEDNNQPLTLESLEKKHICLTLEKLMGNKTQAAKALGITVKTLYNKLHTYGMI